MTGFCCLWNKIDFLRAVKMVFTHVPEEFRRVNEHGSARFFYEILEEILLDFCQNL